MAALDHVLALHAELHEQENVLSMFMGQRDEALAAQRAQQDEMASLRAEKAQLQANIASRQTAEGGAAMRWWCGCRSSRRCMT